MYLPLSRKQNKSYKQPKKDEVIPQTNPNDKNFENEGIQTESFAGFKFSEFIKWKEKKKKNSPKSSGG